MLDNLDTVLCGLTASSLGYAAIRRFGVSDGRVRDRLAIPIDDDPTPRGPWFGGFAPVLLGLVPTRPATRDALARELRSAGCSSGETAVDNVLALRALLTALPLLIAGYVGLVVPTDKVVIAAVVGVVTALVGFSVPRTWVQWKAKAHDRLAEKALPATLDLLSLSLAAGQGLTAAIGHTSRELRRAHPVMADELRVTLRFAEMHSLAFALEALCDRFPTGEMRTLALILEQSHRLGSDVAAALTQYADHSKTMLRQRAEAKANRTSFWMLFPTIFCLLMASAIILIGPAYL
jgi:tight adherence protein C